VNPLQRATEMLADAEEFNAEVRAALDTITLADAIRIIDIAEEIKGWMMGIKELLGGNK